MTATSNVTVLPIFGSSTGQQVTAGTVLPNYPSRSTTSSLLTNEWWPVNGDPLSLIDIKQGPPMTLNPVGQPSDSTFPTITSTSFTTVAGKNGLLLPYDDTNTSTLMFVVKRPTTTYGDICGNYSDISGNTADGVHVYWTGATVYVDCRAPVISGSNLNAPSQGAISAGDWVFLYMREDATGLQINYGGSTNPEKSYTTSFPRTLSSRRKSLGNRWMNNSNYLIEGQAIAWAGYTNSKLTTGNISTIYTDVKAALATLGITVK